MSDLTWVRGAELPTGKFWWRDSNQQLIDLSSGYTFELKLGKVGRKALLTKTSGITGAAGSGAEPSGVPNLVVSWSAGDLDVPHGTYDLQIRGTSGGLDRVLYKKVTILENMR